MLADPGILTGGGQTLQAVLFFSLLAVVAIWDIRFRLIPDGLQIGIALLTLLDFSPGNLLGIFGAFPYLAVALFADGEEGIGGGDVKLAGAIGLVLGLPASLTASIVGLSGFVLFGVVCRWQRKRQGKVEKAALPVGPFLGAGAAYAYFMKMGGGIV
uniref:prepilin peptidase n=1 Tax=Enterocloster clostridioformis TaxID=1531 RepID=UPI0026F1AA9E|nr:prepilin peptidase [Enterocloster clostridioformis]